MLRTAKSPAGVLPETEMNVDWERPSPAQTWKAIEIYLQFAYSGRPPLAVQNRLKTLRDAGEAGFYGCPSFEMVQGDPGRLALRLGNRLYPHMKLVIERSPDGKGHLFRADTHDRHCAPDPASREYPAYAELCRENQAIASAIESGWEQAQLPTFKSYLREDLARRKQQVSA